MFCACLSIVICLVVLICGTTVSIIDVTRYDFGLYYALLAIVGLTAAVAICVVRPRRGCCMRDPQWYTRCCERLNACLISEQQRITAKTEGNTYSIAAGDDPGGDKRSGASSVINRQQRATLVMLRPAVELMQHMLHGLVNRGDDGNKDNEEEDTSEATDDIDEERRRRKSKRKKKKKLMLPANEACLYTILETSTADVTMVGHTEATSVVTIHEASPQLLNDSVPNSPAALVPSSSSTTPRQQVILAQKKHLANQTSSGSPKLRGSDGQTCVFTFHRHDVLSETVDEERPSETRGSSTHE